LFAAFLIMTAVLLIVPGPIITLVIAIGASQGMRVALITVSAKKKHLRKQGPRPHFAARFASADCAITLLIDCKRPVAAAKSHTCFFNPECHACRQLADATIPSRRCATG